jgi:hypothetical protein
MTLQGPIQFAKVSTNRFNQLTLQSGGWTNASSQILTYLQSPSSRDLISQTNYYGNLTFADGDLNTAAADYYEWYLSIDDTNDVDKNGIPDFSDDPLVLLARRPLLTLTGTKTNCWLTISGDINRLHEIQESTNLSTGWLPVISFTLTNDPQTVSLPLPATGAKFWRVRAQ